MSILDHIKEEIIVIESSCYTTFNSSHLHFTVLCIT